MEDTTEREEEEEEEERSHDSFPPKRPSRSTLHQHQGAVAAAIPPTGAKRPSRSTLHQRQGAVAAAIPPTGAFEVRRCRFKRGRPMLDSGSPPQLASSAACSTPFNGEPPPTDDRAASADPLRESEPLLVIPNVPEGSERRRSACGSAASTRSVLAL